MMINSPDTLLKYVRDGLVEEQHFGYVMVLNRVHVIDRVGECGGYPFYRENSCTQSQPKRPRPWQSGRYWFDSIPAGKIEYNRLE